MHMLLSVKGLFLIYTLVWVYLSKLPLGPELTALAVPFQNKELKDCLGGATPESTGQHFRDKHICVVNSSKAFYWRDGKFGVRFTQRQLSDFPR